MNKSNDASALRVAVVGTGRIARMFHLRVLAAMPDVEIVAIADPDDEALGTASRGAIDAAPLRHFAEVLDRDDVEFLVLCTPSGDHAAQAVAAFQSGRHVWVEKPVATTLADARLVESAWRAAGTVGAVGHVFRVHPQVVSARSALAAGDIGNVVAVNTTVCSSPRELPEWKRAASTGGGALLDLASHHVDLVAHLLDSPIESVVSTARSERTEHDNVSLLVRNREGVVASITASSTAPQADRLEFMGDRGSLVIDRFRSDQIQWTSTTNPTTRVERVRRLVPSGRRALGTVRADVAPRPEPSFAEAMRRAVSAARGSGTPVADVADGVRVASVLDAATRSIDTGKWTDVEDGTT